jgi:hypothetical protein
LAHACVRAILKSSTQRSVASGFKIAAALAKTKICLFTFYRYEFPNFPQSNTRQSLIGGSTAFYGPFNSSLDF